MAIGKMLNLGGIDNRPPKTNQSINRFRVARNVYPTPDGKLIPRYDWTLPDGSLPGGIKAFHYITQYTNDALCFVTEEDFYKVYRNTTVIPRNAGGSPLSVSSTDLNNSVMSFRRNNTTYFIAPEFANNPATLIKYDGIQMWPMGASQPIISTAVANGTAYLRTIQHTIDFDNNETSSEYVEFDFLSSLTTVTVGGSGISGNMINTGRATNPQSVVAETGIAPLFFRGTSAYNAGTQDYTITTTDTNITTSDSIGAYVMVDWYSGGLALAALGVNGYGMAMKVKSISPLKLDAKDIKYLDTNREWKTKASVSASLGTNLTLGTQTFFSFWRSVSQTGVYYFCSFAPSFPNSTNPFNIGVDTSPLSSAEITSGEYIITLAPILSDIYDVITRKLSPNSLYPFGLNQGLYGMTVYQDSLLLASDDLIWLSDPTLGGTFEQLNTSYFIRVGDTEYGRITSICGTNDFLLVSRERKNYYVTGNLTTGNYRVQEIIEAEIGAWSNNSSILVKDSVIFLTSLGVFQVVGGSKATKLSDTCPKNFARYDGTNVNEDVSFVMSGTVSDITNTVVDGLSVAYDEYRELLVFMKKGVVNNPCLVLHVSSGEFYEWDGMYTGVTNVYGNCLGFINASYYIGAIDYTATPNAIYGFESTSVSRTYAITNPIKLCTSWLTGGEPSLEKSLLQLKLFGRIQANPNSFGANYPINIFHYKDWDITTKITNTEYYPQNTALSLNNQIQYSHKKRLTSDKVLSASVGLEINTSGAMFELESIEVEFNPIQEGMKK